MKTLSFLFVLGLAAPVFAQAQPPGAAVFENNCAVCHATGADPRTPTVDQLRERT